jgi:predicted O-methyltransferase YrrM
VSRIRGPGGRLSRKELRPNPIPDVLRVIRGVGARVGELRTLAHMSNINLLRGEGAEDSRMTPVATRKNEFGEVEILTYRKSGLLFYYQSGFFQSEADSNGISLAPYIHAIYGMIAQSEAQDVLMIGCGGGSLGTMLAKASIKVTIVDKNPASFEMARDYFSLPAAIDCHVADGKAFLLKSEHRYDAIVLDAFDGPDIPPHLQTLEFFRLVESRLHRSRGCIFSNLIADHDLDKKPDRYAAIARRAWNEVRLLDTQGLISRNTLMMAGNVTRLRKPVLRMQPSMGREKIAVGLGNMVFRPWRYD